MNNQEKPLWSDTHNFESVNLFQTKHLSNAIYNLFEDIQVLKEEKVELERALKSTNAELSGAIDQVNHFFEYHHPLNSLDEPENWDKQTCFENQILLKEQGG